MSNKTFIVIGCGSIGKRHIRNLLRLKAGRILAFDHSPQRVKEVKKEFGARVEASVKLEELWKRNPGAAVIATPTNTHIPLARKAVQRACHLFIEKPLSHNDSGIEALRKTVRRKNLVCSVGYNFRFNRCLLKIKELLEQKKIGRLITGRTISGSYLPERHPGEDYRRSYAANAAQGGGIILDALSHHLDFAHFLFGEPKEVFCSTQKRSRLKIRAEDTADVLLKFSDGLVILLHSNSLQRPYKRTLELVGEKGTIFCDFVEGWVKWFDVKDRRWHRFNGERNDNDVYLREMKHFLECLKGQVKPAVDLPSAQKEMGMIMKIKRSGQQRKWVKL